MLLSTVYIHVQREATRRWEKATEGHGTEWMHMETYGSLWKMQDQSIDKYVSDGQSGLESQTEMGRQDKIGRKELGKQGSP